MTDQEAVRVLAPLLMSSSITVAGAIGATIAWHRGSDVALFFIAGMIAPSLLGGVIPSVLRLSRGAIVAALGGAP